MAEPDAQRELERVVRALRAAGAGTFEVTLPARRVRFGAALRALLGADERTLPDALEALEARIHPEDLDRVRAAVDRQEREPGPLSVEFRARGRGGRFVWLQAIGEGVRSDAHGDELREAHRDPHGDASHEAHGDGRHDAQGDGNADAEGRGGARNRSGAASSIVRVSGLVRAAELRRQPGRDGATTARASFLAAMSHEIRTPMTAILGFADLLRDGASPGDAIAAAEAIHRNGQHLVKIVNDILDLSRIEAGAMTLEEIAVAPAAMASEVCASFAPRARERGIELVVELLGPVPALIRTDPTRLRQILINLVDNALKFTESGFVRVGLERGPGESLRFHVSDTGIGVTPEQVEHIFGPFAQGDATTPRRFGGSGLGLDISRRLARMLGGEITVRSTPGRGSTFTAEVSTGPLAGVPLATAIESSLGAPRHASDSGTDDAHGAGRSRVLLAEDGADNQRLLRHHLERDGLEVTAVGDGRAALDAAIGAQRRGAPFDLVLLDMQMPRMDGLEATRALRDAGFAGPIIMLTAQEVAGARERCRAAGCDEVLAKPIERSRLSDAVRRQLELPRELGPRGA